MKVLYFAWVRERIGKAQEEIELPAGVATVGELMHWLSARGEEYASAFANPLYVWGNVSWYLSFLAFYGVLVLAPLVTVSA